MLHYTPLRWLLLALVALLVVLQYRLWIAEGSLAEQRRLERQVQEQTRVNDRLKDRNAVLEREVLELQSGNRGIEQRAREQLGLIREGETFYQFVEGDDATDRRGAAGHTRPQEAPASISASSEKTQ